MPSPIGTRIIVTGSTCSGKSTLAGRLARDLHVPFVELDALNWEPNWHDVSKRDPAEFERRISEATAGDGWVVAGSYSRFSKRLLNPYAQTIIWLDLPLPLILRRVLARSWRRWRTKELLWGTNYENFWSHLKLWSDESLLHWAVTNHRVKRRNSIASMADPAFAHLRWIRLTSPEEVEAFVAAIEAALAGIEGTP